MNPDAIARRLIQNQERFRRYVAVRTGSSAEVDDVLQMGLIKAVRLGASLRDDQRLDAWFYRILATTLVDHARSRNAARRRETEWIGLSSAPEPDDPTPCRCIMTELGQLEGAGQALLNRVEVHGEAVNAVAASLGITPGNASVRLHRARRTMRSRLAERCGECAREGCRNCHCEHGSQTDSV